MDTTKPSAFSSPNVFDQVCSPAELSAQWASTEAPLVIDVRNNEAFAASGYTLPGALRRDPQQVATWAATLPEMGSVLVYCVHGHEVSQAVQCVLQQKGIRAMYLRGGIEAWREAGLALSAKAPGSATRWVTRERPKIDRIACPWLVRRFVDAQAQFLYVPTAQVQLVASQEEATPYDVNADVARTPFTHHGDLCSFDAFMDQYRLGSDTALVRLASIVRGADTDRFDLAPQAAGLLAVSLGMSRSIGDDLTMLEAMMPIYDALYAWCRDAVAGADEQHNWKPA